MPIAAIKTAGAYLIQADHLNTPRAILGASNALVWKWDSDAFGSTAANENPSALGIFNYNPRFPGQYYDKESALHYNYFRDSYNPKTGRYFQSDPIGLAGGINTYAYVGGNPVTGRDPLGLCPMCLIAANPYVVGAVAAAGSFIAAVVSSSGQRQSPDHEALGDLVRDVTNGGRKPLSSGDADTILDWGRELGIGVRDDRDTDHWTGGPHIHVPGTGVRHIPTESKACSK